MKYVKILIILFLLSGSQVYSQDYPKYRNKKTHGAAAKPVVKKEESVKNEVTQMPDALPEKEALDDYMELIKKASKLYLEKKFEESLKIYNQAFPLANKDNVYMTLMGRAPVYYALKDYNNSLKDYTALIEDTKLPHENARGMTYLMRALNYKMLNNNDAACADYKMARLLDVVKGMTLPGFENCD